jgi:hypothetical protein
MVGKCVHYILNLLCLKEGAASHSCQIESTPCCGFRVMWWNPAYQSGVFLWLVSVCYLEYLHDCLTNLVCKISCTLWWCWVKIHKYLNSVRVISVVAILTSALVYSVLCQQTVLKTKLVVWCVTYVQCYAVMVPSEYEIWCCGHISTLY